MKILSNKNKSFTVIDEVENRTDRCQTIVELRRYWQFLGANPDELELALEHMYNKQHNVIHMGDANLTFQFTEKVSSDDN